MSLLLSLSTTYITGLDVLTLRSVFPTRKLEKGGRRMKFFNATILYCLVITLGCESSSAYAANLVSTPTNPLDATSSNVTTSLRIVEDFLSEEHEIQDFLAYFERSDNIHTACSTVTIYTPSGSERYTLHL
jgi:hypothetical protein